MYLIIELDLDNYAEPPPKWFKFISIFYEGTSIMIEHNVYNFLQLFSYDPPYNIGS